VVVVVELSASVVVVPAGDEVVVVGSGAGSGGAVLDVVVVGSGAGSVDVVVVVLPGSEDGPGSGAVVTVVVVVPKPTPGSGRPKSAIAREAGTQARATKSVVNARPRQSGLSNTRVSPVDSNDVAGDHFEFTGRLSRKNRAESGRYDARPDPRPATAGASESWPPHGGA
jgi:hypothetical protein